MANDDLTDLGDEANDLLDKASAVGTDLLDDATDAAGDAAEDALDSEALEAIAKKMPKKKKGDSQGKRLSAARAAKAARKAAAAKRAEEERQAAAPVSEEIIEESEEFIDEVPLEDEYTEREAAANDWFEDNKTLIYGIVGAVAVALIGLVLYNNITGTKGREATGALTEALDISAARVVEESEEGSSAGDEQVFTSIAAKREAELQAFQGVASSQAGTDVEVWARLGEGRVLLEQSKFDEALAAFNSALSVAKDPFVTARSLEGLGFAHEGKEAWTEALSKYTELGELADGRYAHLAGYHKARMKLAQGDTDAAKEAFRTLVEDIRSAQAEGEPVPEFVQSRAETQLQILDPSSVRRGGGGGGAPPGGIPPELLEQLRQQMGQAGG